MAASGQSNTIPAKARLVTVDKYSASGDISKEVKEIIEVDFNPQSLKLNFQNQIEGDKQSKSKGTQYVGSSSSTLTVELIFDSTQDHKGGKAGSDVRKKTKAIADSVLPSKDGGGQGGKSKPITPPKVRFEWGSFLFEGIVTTMSETLEYFSAQGVPLRATVALTMTRPAVAILIKDLGNAAGAGSGLGSPDTTPKTPLPAGDSLQKAIGRTGNSGDWRSVANANNIDNPLRPPSGKLFDLSAGGSASGSIGLGGSFGTSASIGGNAGLSGAAGGSLSGSLSASGQAGVSADVKFRR